MEKVIKILLVEDEPGWQHAISQLLEDLSSKLPLKLLKAVDNYWDGLAAFQAHKPDFILLDWQIQGEKSGLDLGNKLMTLGVQNHQIILISGANPNAIPHHEFLYVPKTQIAEALVPLLTSLYSN